MSVHKKFMTKKNKFMAVETSKHFTLNDATNYVSHVTNKTRGQSNLTKSNLTKSASRGPIPRLGVTPGGRKLYH